jgi:hypothetical protein
MEENITSSCISTKDIIWLAGLLEGEAYFGLKRGYPEIILSMADKDIIERAALLFGSNLQNPILRSKKNPKWKDAWRTSVNGRNATAWMMMIYSLMGQRRREKIKSVIAGWLNNGKFIVGHGQHENCKKGIKVARHVRWHVNRNMPNHECQFCIEMHGHIDPPVKPPKVDRRHSEEFKQMMSRLKSGKNNPNYGKPRSEETRRKIAMSNTGKKQSEESRRKMSDAHKKSWENGAYSQRDISGEKNPNYGKSRSFEVRKKIAESNKRTWAKKLAEKEKA